MGHWIEQLGHAALAIAFYDGFRLWTKTPAMTWRGVVGLAAAGVGLVALGLILGR